MEFPARLSVNIDAALRALGIPGQAGGGSAISGAGANAGVTDEVGCFGDLGHTTAALRQAAARAEQAATPRWVYKVYNLQGRSQSAPQDIPQAPVRLEDGLLALPGNDILRHLEGCDGCVLLALTLGEGLEQALRFAAAQSAAEALLLDAAASTLAEQYADEALRLLCEEAKPKGRWLTGRFSPGYGDLPLGLQSDILRLLNAQRAIGLTASQSHLLMPRKSITAVVGSAPRPVSGAVAGCRNCVLNNNCTRQKEGDPCGKNSL